MIGRTNVAGGDPLKNAYAIISVEYPAGSILICTNAATGKTYRAGNTYGLWAFGVNSDGTWRVTASNSATGESAFYDVEITAEHQTERVQLDYWVNQLYENGNEFISVTGGWDTRDWKGESGWRNLVPTLFKTSDYMEISWNNGGGSSSYVGSGAVEILKDFDFSRYSRIEVTLDCSLASSSTLYMVVTDRSNEYSLTRAKASTSISSPRTSTDYTVNLDISSVNGAFDFAFVTRCTSNQHSVKVKKVLLF